MLTVAAVAVVAMVAEYFGPYPRLRPWAAGAFVAMGVAIAAGYRRKVLASAGPYPTVRQFTAAAGMVLMGVSIVRAGNGLLMPAMLLICWPTFLASFQGWRKRRRATPQTSTWLF